MLRVRGINLASICILKRGCPLWVQMSKSLWISAPTDTKPKEKHKNKRRTRGKKMRSERGTEKRKKWTRRNEEIMRRRRKPPRKAYFSFCFPHCRKICDLRRGKTKALTGSSGQLCACSYFSLQLIFFLVSTRFWSASEKSQSLENVFSRSRLSVYAFTICIPTNSLGSTIFSIFF